jgi:hypothetical protein
MPKGKEFISVSAFQPEVWHAPPWASIALIIAVLFIGKRNKLYAFFLMPWIPCIFCSIIFTSNQMHQSKVHLVGCKDNWNYTHFCNVLLNLYCTTLFGNIVPFTKRASQAVCRFDRPVLSKVMHKWKLTRKWLVLLFVFHIFLRLFRSKNIVTDSQNVTCFIIIFKSCL